MFLLIALAGLIHPIHLSNTEIAYSSKSKSIQIISRFFADDLQGALRPELDIFAPESAPIVKTLLEQYLRKHIRFRPEKGRYADYPITFVGYKEEDSTSIVCYLEIENVAPPTALVVFNDALMEVYRDQYNLVHVTFGDVVKSARLTPDERMILLKP